MAVLIERVVTVGFKRYVTAPVAPSIGGPRSGKKPGPQPGFKQLRTEVEAMAGKVGQGGVGTGGQDGALAVSACAVNKVHVQAADICCCSSPSSLLNAASARLPACH